MIDFIDLHGFQRLGLCCFNEYKVSGLQGEKKVLEMMVIMAAQQCKCLMSLNCKLNVAKTGKYIHIHTYAYYSTGFNFMHIVKHEISMWHKKIVLWL